MTRAAIAMILMAMPCAEAQEYEPIDSSYLNVETVYVNYTPPSSIDYDTLTVADIYELFGGIPNSLHFWFGEITRNYRTYMVFHYELLTPSDTLYPVPEWKRGR